MNLKKAIPLPGHRTWRGKDVLGIYVGENESAKFWPSIMNGLKNRTEIWQGIIRQIRNSKKFVSYKDIKKLRAGRKRLDIDRAGAGSIPS